VGEANPLADWAGLVPGCLAKSGGCLPPRREWPGLVERFLERVVAFWAGGGAPYPERIYWLLGLDPDLWIGGGDSTDGSLLTVILWHGSYNVAVAGARPLTSVIITATVILVVKLIGKRYGPKSLSHLPAHRLDTQVN